MTEKRHTPGPWEFSLEAVRTVIFHRTEIGEKAIAVGAGSYPDHVSNARLISAAPDLLEIAIRILVRGYVSESIDEEKEDHKKLVSAIEKALGR